MRELSKAQPLPGDREGDKDTGDQYKSERDRFYQRRRARRSDAQKEMVTSGWESYASRRERLREGSVMEVACRNGRMGRDEGISIPGRQREK